MELFCPTCGKSLGSGPVDADGVECWPCTMMGDTIPLTMEEEMLRDILEDAQDFDPLKFECMGTDDMPF